MEWLTILLLMLAVPFGIGLALGYHWGRSKTPPHPSPYDVTTPTKPAGYVPPAPPVTDWAVPSGYLTASDRCRPAGQLPVTGPFPPVGGTSPALLTAGLLRARRLGLYWGAGLIVPAVLWSLRQVVFGLLIALGVLIIAAAVWRLLAVQKKQPPGHRPAAADPGQYPSESTDSR